MEPNICSIIENVSQIKRRQTNSNRDHYKNFYVFTNPGPYSLKNIGGFSRHDSIQKHGVEFGWENKFVKKTITISGIVFTRISSLDPFYEHVISSQDILNLKMNWDGYNALPVDRGIWKITTRFLVELANEIHESSFNILASPDINPSVNGGIHLSWRNNSARLLIIFEKSDQGEICINYYGDLMKSDAIKSGPTPFSNFAPNVLKVWMKTHLKTY